LLLYISIIISFCIQTMDTKWIISLSIIILLNLSLQVYSLKLTNRLKTNTHAKTKNSEDVTPFYSLSARSPHTSLEEFMNTGVMAGDDYLSQVRALIESQNSTNYNEDGDQVLLEVGASAKTKKVEAYCEICILVMQMKERGQPHLCYGLNENYYITCVKILISLLRADKALVYWLKNGCMHLDTSGPEIVRPCPAMNICSWVPNLFSQPPSLVKDGVESLCPKDNKFLPTIPIEYKNLLDQAGATPGAGSPAAPTTPTTPAKKP